MSTNLSWLENETIVKYNSEQKEIYAHGCKAWGEYLVKVAKGEAATKTIDLRK